MKAYKCDICGKLYPYSIAHDDRDYKIKKWGPVNSIMAKFDFCDMDICDECYTSFQSWMKMRKVAMTGKEVSDGSNEALAYTD